MDWQHSLAPQSGASVSRTASRADDRIIETSIPARLDSLRWSGFHTRVVVALGITWILDGLEVTLAGALSGAGTVSSSWRSCVSVALALCDDLVVLRVQAVPPVPELPPGPPLPRVIQTFGFMFAGPRFLEACRRRYGNAVTFSTLFDQGFVMVFDPALVKEVFQGSGDQLHAGEANALLGPILGARSVLLLDGAEHLRHRRLMLPAFHGRAMHAYADAHKAFRSDVPANVANSLGFAEAQLCKLLQRAFDEAETPALKQVLKSYYAELLICRQAMWRLHARLAA